MNIISYQKKIKTLWHLKLDLLVIVINKFITFLNINSKLNKLKIYMINSKNKINFTLLSKYINLFKIIILNYKTNNN